MCRNLNIKTIINIGTDCVKKDISKHQNKIVRYIGFLKIYKYR